MEEDELIFCAIVADKRYNLYAIIGVENKGWKLKLKANLLDIVRKSMRCILQAGNISYTEREFSKFMKDFKHFELDGHKLVESCCALIYKNMIKQLKNDNIIVAGTNRHISDDINNCIINLEKFFEYIASDLQFVVADNFLKRNLDFLQIFSIINNRAIEVNIKGREYVIVDKEVLKHNK